MLSYQWKPAFETIQQNNNLKHLNINSIITQILIQRGFSEEKEVFDFLECKKPPEETHHPKYLKDMEKAVDRVIQVINSKQNILIYGDYDVDGITSTSLLYMLFQAISYFNKIQINLDVILPDRIIDGYGLKIKGVEQAIERKINLIITVDNGISSDEAVDLAAKNDIDVIIIDHHNVQNIIPKAYAIINPKQDDCNYPDKRLSAVGLVYKFAEALGEHLLNQHEKEMFLNRYIDFVAIGTYQDLSPLIGENRYFVKNGISNINRLLNSGKTNLQGVLDLIKINCNNKIITHKNLGYDIGPVINSAGRIDNPLKAFKLLTSTNPQETFQIANSLKIINDQRKKWTEEAYHQAEIIIKSENLNNNPIIVLKSNTWHQGIIGLIAQRIMKNYKKSVIVMSNRSANYYTASARSYGNQNILENIKKLKNYLIYFGGHSKAAGFSINDEKLLIFEKELYKLFDLSQNDDHPDVIKIDYRINFNDFTNQFFDDYIKLYPFGEGNPEPVFLTESVIVKDIRISKRKLDTLFNITQNKIDIFFVMFNNTSNYDIIKVGDQIDIVYTIDSFESELKGIILDLKLSKK